MDTSLRRFPGRTVYVILLGKVAGRDLRVIVLPDVTEKVCAKHKNAIIDAALRLFFDILACGINQEDMQSRNIIMSSCGRKSRY